MTPADGSDHVEHDGRDERDRRDRRDRRDADETAGATDSGDSGDKAAEGVEPDTEPDWVRRRRLDAVFGDGAHGQALGDRWYRDQVPPHHG